MPLIEKNPVKDPLPMQTKKQLPGQKEADANNMRKSVEVLGIKDETQIGGKV